MATAQLRGAVSMGAAERKKRKTSADVRQRAHADRHMVHTLRGALNGISLHALIMERAAEGELPVEAARSSLASIQGEIARIVELIDAATAPPSSSGEERLAERQAAARCTLSGLCEETVALVLDETRQAGVQLESRIQVDADADIPHRDAAGALKQTLQRVLAWMVVRDGRVLLNAHCDEKGVFIDITSQNSSVAPALPAEAFEGASPAFAECGGTLKLRSTPRGAQVRLELPVESLRLREQNS